jgi:uncharacterized protein involved in exopolysaccharide biosynthesis
VISTDSSPDQSTAQDAATPAVDIVDIVSWLWRRRLTIIAITAACTISMLTYSLLSPPVYTAQVTLLPQSDGANAGLLSSVASFTGLNLEAEANFEQMYGQIVLSDRLLATAIDRTWRHRDFAEETTLFEIFGVGDPQSTNERAYAEKAKLIGKLRSEVVSFYRDERSGYMALRVTVPVDSRFAADLANFLAHQLDAFNQAFRSRQAAEQEAFVRERLDEAQRGLNAAAGRLSEFVESNRSYRASPTLLQRYEELEREVQAELSVWVELRRQLELAKIERNKNTASINILDEARPPVRKSGPRHAVNGLAGIAFGVIVSLAWLVGRALVGAVAARGAGAARP